MPAMMMAHEVDPRQSLLDKLGDLKDVEVFHNQVICAVYIRPEKTKGGLILSDQTRDEDRSQSKVGLIVKMGDMAFKDNDGGDIWCWAPDMSIGDWIYYRASDGWPTTIIGQSGEKILCRILDDVRVKGRVQHPDQVW